MGSLESSLRTALETARSERELQPFLKQHPLIVRNALNVWAWNYVAVLQEFQLGADYRADYLILSADSGSWHSVFVELKSHRAQAFTREGVPSRDLNLALRQIDDWARWIDRHKALFRESLSGHLADDDVPAQCSPADLHTKAAAEILDPHTVVHEEFRIVIGRREGLTQEDQERRGSYYTRGCEIVTYDRFLDMARKIDGAEKAV